MPFRLQQDEANWHNDHDEVKQAIHDAKYPPVGERGIAPFFAQYLDGVSARDVVDNANDETPMLLGTLSAVEMGLSLAEIEHKSGGILEAMNYLEKN